MRLLGQLLGGREGGGARGGGGGARGGEGVWTDAVAAGARTNSLEGCVERGRLPPTDTPTEAHSARRSRRCCRRMSISTTILCGSSTQRRREAKTGGGEYEDILMHQMMLNDASSEAVMSKNEWSILHRTWSDWCGAGGGV